MKTNWRTDLTSAMRRLEALIPHAGKISSLIIHANTEDEIKAAKIGDLLTVKGPTVSVKIQGTSRQYRLIAFNRQSSKAAMITPLLIEMSHALEEMSHPIFGDDKRSWARLGGIKTSIENGVVDWLLALHRFAHRLPETHIINTDNGQPADWNDHQSLATLVEDTATASARFADWMLTDLTIQDLVDAGHCPVQLIGEDKPPLLNGKSLPAPLSPEQYALIEELVKEFPKGLTVKDFEARKSTQLIQNPRHVLMRLRGNVPLPKRQTPWTNVIAGPGSARLGWRLNPSK